jgi:alkylated DNA repair protein (DNA oxidative demethylase)
MPTVLTMLWNEIAGVPEAECCLVNLYRAKARMGLHQDKDEKALASPVVSGSLGDDAIFRIGGAARRGPAKSLKLASGDVVMFGGPARLAYHGIDRIVPGSSRLVPGGGRLSLTLRRVAA